MLTHIDKEIFINAFLVYNKDTITNSRDFLDFLRSESDVIVYGEKDADSNNILSKFLAGRGNTKIFSRPGKFTKQQINENNPYQLVFIDVEDEIQRQQFENEIECLIGFKDNYETVFEEFKSEPSFRVDKDGSIDKNSSVTLFASWNQILPDLPITEIIISDPYIIADNEWRPLSENLFGLLSAIKSKYQIESILVFTKIDDINELNKIEGQAQQIFGPQTICKFPLFQGRKEEHDRHIFTNYKHISLGSSANFFDNEGNITVKSTSNIHTFSYSKTEKQQAASIILDDLNTTLKGLKSKGRIRVSITSRLLDYKEGSRE